MTYRSSLRCQRSSRKLVCSFRDVCVPKSLMELSAVATPTKRGDRSRPCSEPRRRSDRRSRRLLGTLGFLGSLGDLGTRFPEPLVYGALCLRRNGGKLLRSLLQLLAEAAI